MEDTTPLSDAAGAGRSTARAPVDRLPTGLVINGRYHVDAFLGAGGMGSVYRVSDSAQRDRPLALKTLRGDLVGPDRLDLFKSEFRIMTGFHHPNVARVYDFERMHGTATDFFTMDYVDGRDIYRATDGADGEAVLDLFVQMCRALAYVHSRQLIHFDIKPSNVLVSSLGRVRVLDFGIAGTARHGGCRTIGTPAYMAPELFDAGRADHRADLFSVGIILYQLLTRTEPRVDLPPHARIDIAGADARVPAWLGRVIHRLCATDPADRFRSANAVIEAINKAGGRTYEIETPQTRQSYVLSSRFIGRRHEMRQIMNAVNARTLTGGTAAPMLFVSGPGGIGKSRLMREVRHRVQLSGVAFVEASCYEGSFSPYGPLTRAVMDLMRLNEGLDASVPADPPAEIHSEEAAPGAPAGDADARREQLRIREQAVEFLMATARRVPYVLGLNDLHWAQPATLDILTQLARRLRAADQAGSPVPLAVLVTFRDEEMAGHPFEPILRNLHHTRTADGASLAPLNADEVAGLVGSMVGADPPAEFAERLARETAGVPFFVEEVMRTLVEQGSVTFEHGVWASAGAIIPVPVSASMVNVLRQRAAVLATGPRILLTAIAACARPASPVMLSEATGLDPEEFASALRLLLHRRLVVVLSGESVTYAVAHDRMRDVIYADLSPDEKRTVHESIARAIERVWPDQLDAHVYELAHHYWLGHDRDKAFVYSSRGAERARAAYANDLAVELFTRVMDLLEGRDPALKLEIAEKLGDLDASHGRFEDALVRYREILPALERTANQARLFRKIANVHWQRGELGTGVDWLWRAVEALGDRRPSSRIAQVTATARAVGRHVLHQLRSSPARSDIAERGRLLELSAIYLQLGEAYFFHDSSLMLLPILRASNAGERAGGDSGELCRACHAVVVLYGTLTWWRSAERCAHRLADMAARLESDWHIGAAHTYWLILHYYRSQWRLGIDRGRLGKELLARCGDVMELSFAYWVTALCYYYRGELRQAAEWSRQGLDAMARADSAQPAKGILVVSARVNARLGRGAVAREQIERSFALATDARDLFLLTWAQMMMGDCLLVEGQIEEAVVWLENARRQREANGLLPEFLIEVYPLLADARLEQLERQTQLLPWERRRRLGEIAGIARKAVRLSRRRRHYRAAALRTLATCCWRQGRRRRAIRLFEESMAVAEALGAPLQLADVHESWGRCLAEAGSPAGRGHLERARELFEETGAATLAQRVSSTIMRLEHLD